MAAGGDVTRSGQRPGQDRVSLAHEPAFALGPLAIEPALRRIVHSDGREEFVEPRVMQVLVALARADGTILSRDDLILSCWEGRIVGEDAINRVMSRLRRLSETLGRGAFRVETITKVGYRLVPEAAPPPRGLDGGPSPAPPRPGTEEAGPALQGPSAAASLGDSGDAGGSSPAIAPPGFSRRATALAAGAAALLLAIAAGLGSQLWKGPAGPVSVAVVGQGDSGSGGLAREIMVDLARLAGVRGSRLTITELPAGAQFVVRIARTRPGNGERLDLSLAAGEGGEVLWSSSLEGNAAGPAALRPQASARIGQVLLCALRRSKDGEMLPPQLLGLYMAACEKMQALPDQQLVTLLQRITDEAPAFAPAWGDLAITQSSQYPALRYGVGVDAPEARSLLARVRGYIQKARSLDPDNASAFVAEAELLDPGKFAERLALIERALERNAAEPLLHAQHSSALFAVGRLTEAIGAAERAAALDPLSPNTQANLASALAHAGAVNRARRTLADAELQWPESEQIRATRFSIELRYGDPRIAQQMIDAGQASLGGPTGGFGGPEILMRARLNPTPENIERMVRFASAETRRAPQAVALRMQALGHAGAVDEFYNLLDQPGIVAHLQDATEVLFRPHIKAFRDDPRFLRLAAQLGLLHYWAASKRWPDFCSDPRLPYNCEQDGQRIFRGG